MPRIDNYFLRRSTDVVSLCGLKRSLDLLGSREVDIMNDGKDIFADLMNDLAARRNQLTKRALAPITLPLIGVVH